MDRRRLIAAIPARWRRPCCWRRRRCGPSRASRTAPSRSSSPSPPAARPTPSPASSPRAWAATLASRWWWKTSTGAGGTIAAARVAQARPDGHTLLMHHIGHATSATLYRRLPYSVTDSFAPLGLVSDAAMTLVARPDFPAADLAGFMAEIRSQGDALNLAHSGLGGANHLCGMLLQHTAGTAMTAWSSAAARRPSLTSWPAASMFSATRRPTPRRSSATAASRATP